MRGRALGSVVSERRRDVIAFLFPGQGSQRPKLLADSSLAFDAREIFDRASEHLGIDVMLEDDESALRHPEIVQRNVFLAGFAGGFALRRAGIEPDAFAGHSVGAVVAATLAGVFTFADALDFVGLRGRAMGRIGPGYGMGAIVGVSQRTVRSMIDSFELRDAVYVAAVNAPDQTVIAGADGAVDRVLELARQGGAPRASRLDVMVPSHTPLMGYVRTELGDVLRRLELGRPEKMLASNVDGGALFSKADVARDLADGVAAPVRWHDATQMLYERGVRCFVECYLGDVLTNLIEAAFKDSIAISLQRVGVVSAVTLARRYVTAV